MSKRMGLLLLPLLVLVLGCPAPCVGPNLRAREIQYRLVSTATPTSGRVEIKGIVDNVGTAAFTSGVGQQSVQLWEGPQMVASQAFQNVALDETVEVVYERDWSTANEFNPPTYQLVISLDPDIYMDENENNDDCTQTNNTVSRSTAGINALFAP